MNQEELFKKAVTENHRMIYAICLHFFGSEELAQDAYQETLIKVWQNIKNFRGESKLSTWISRIAANICLTGIEKEKRKLTLFTSLTQNMGYPDNTSEEQEREATEQERIRFFQEFKKRLNPVDRLLVSLYLEEDDYKEIALITGLSESNARTRVHRIKNQIKKEWEENHGTGRF